MIRQNLKQRLYKTTLLHYLLYYIFRIISYVSMCFSTYQTFVLTLSIISSSLFLQNTYAENHGSEAP